MPNINLYIPDEVYQFLSTKGKVSTIAAEWIKERVKIEKAELLVK